MHKHYERGSWKKWIALDVWVAIIVIAGVTLWATHTVMKREKISNKTPAVQQSTESKITPEINPQVSTSPFTVKRETSHFVIHCNDEALANEIAAKVEEYYDIPTDLGLGESDFWMKEKVNIYIYDTPQQYSNATGRQHWTSGYSEFKTRSIYSYKTVPHLIEGVIPHELTHLIFADFMKFSSNYPEWLSEGLAMYKESKYCKAYVNTYQKILDEMRKGKYFSMDALTNIDISKETKMELIHLWYVQSLSVVTYLIEVYGRGKFYTFCKNLRDGMDLTKALEDAYSPDIKSLPELTGRWLNYIKTHQQSW